MATKDTNSSLAMEGSESDTGVMQPAGKRTVQVNVKMSEDDFELLQRSAQKLWPEAILSNSAIILGLAKIAARDVLSKSGRKVRSSSKT